MKTRRRLDARRPVVELGCNIPDRLAPGSKGWVSIATVRPEEVSMGAVFFAIRRPARHHADLRSGR